MNLQNTFVQSKLNQDIDERLLPKGEYPDALNIRVANSEGSDVGAIENVKGNEKLTTLGLTNAETIGAYSDGSSQKIYWFITSDTKDLVVEYDMVNSETNILLQSTNGVLNFDKNYLITGIVKIINGDSDRDLLIWTDDLNPPRIINIKRAKDTYTLNSFSELDISLVKRPPRYAPVATLTYSPATAENSLQNKFLTFASRYKYLDGGYSALSSFTNYQFSPSKFDLDYQTMENKGMQNAFNAVNIAFNTGDKRVTDIQLVFKESNSNTIYIIESFNKSNEVWGDEETKSFTFTNSKSLVALPEDELFRTFDNVPLTAKALESIGSRIAFGNYVEQRDLKDILGEDIKIDYTLSLNSTELTGEVVPVALSNNTVSNDLLTLDLTGLTLAKENKITVSVEVGNTTYEGSYEDTFDFILNKDFVDAAALAADLDFIYFIEVLITAAFTSGYTATPPVNTMTTVISGFSILSATATSISILAPVITYDVDDTPLDLVDNPTNTHLELSNYQYAVSTNAFYKEIAVDSSAKTNRSYEVGVIYLDADSRTTTVLTNKYNTIYVDQEFSTSQNKIVVTINNKPPVWADRYKLVVKQNKGNYQTIYTNLFYEDGLFRWVKLEGANIGKVREGDTLIVKSDLGGALEDVIKVRVLEISTKDKDFIGDPLAVDNIVEESGVYMKIKPVGFDMNYDSSFIKTYEANSHLRYPTRTTTSPILENTITGGSRVKIKINFKAKGAIAYDVTYDQSFRVNGNYVSFQEWFETEVIDLGSFGTSYTRGSTGGYKDPVSGGVYGFGYGFTDASGNLVATGSNLGERFFVWAHRDGTASRSITTSIEIEVLSSESIIIFETEPEDRGSELFYETAQVFDIVDNFHQGNITNQSLINPAAVVELDFFNCYVMGNGAESYRYKDAAYVGTDDLGKQVVANYLNIDLRPSTTSAETYKQVRRYADITYSEPYNENSNLNGIGIFNLSKANYKEDLDKKYGAIQKLFFRDTNVLVFQEDKVGYVMFGKDILYNADGSSNVSSVESVLGDYVAHAGEYGISRNPESFAFDANNVYFIDSKRGCVCRLGAQGITEISMAGMRKFFKDNFKNAIDQKKLGTYDPYLDQYVVHTTSEE